jgi:hypothetical protein
MILPKNIETLHLIPCDRCKGFEDSRCDVKHWARMHYRYYNHFLIRGEWYVLRERDVKALLSFIEVDSAMQIRGVMYVPEPTRIDNLTDLMTLFKKHDVTDEALATQFDLSQIKRMRGRVLKKLVRA